MSEIRENGGKDYSWLDHCAECEEIHEQNPEPHYCCHCDCHLVAMEFEALLDGQFMVDEEDE